VRLVLAALILTGCTYQREAYAEDYKLVFCIYDRDCELFYVSTASCRSALSAVDELTWDCELVPKRARQCIRDMRELECPPEGEYPDYPLSCDEAYLCPDE
jgi:hypothetical protein